MKYRKCFRHRRHRNRHHNFGNFRNLCCCYIYRLGMGNIDWLCFLSKFQDYTVYTNLPHRLSKCRQNKAYRMLPFRHRNRFRLGRPDTYRFGRWIPSGVYPPRQNFQLLLCFSVSFFFSPFWLLIKFFFSFFVGCCSSFLGSQPHKIFLFGDCLWSFLRVLKRVQDDSVLRFNMTIVWHHKFFIPVHSCIISFFLFLFCKNREGMYNLLLGNILLGNLSHIFVLMGCS